MSEKCWCVLAWARQQNCSKADDASCTCVHVCVCCIDRCLCISWDAHKRRQHRRSCSYTKTKRQLKIFVQPLVALWDLCVSDPACEHVSTNTGNAYDSVKQLQTKIMWLWDRRIRDVNPPNVPKLVLFKPRKVYLARANHVFMDRRGGTVSFFLSN